MKTRTWFLLLGLLSLAGLADVGTYALVPHAIAVYDASPVARFGGAGMVLVGKSACIAAVALLATFAKSVGPTTEKAIGLIPFAGAGLWSYGAWTNVAHGLLR